MTRTVEEFGLIPLYNAKDWAAGADSETVDMGKGGSLDIVVTTGVLTVPGTWSLFSGVTAGAKTTALPFTYRLSGADYLGIGADLYGAEVAEADGILTVSATAHDLRVIVLHIDAADLPVDHRWVTMVVASGTAQFLAAIGVLRQPRYSPSPSSVPLS